MKEKSDQDRKFSVLICVYGKDDPVFFQDAIESILNQSKQPDEVVLVVDGPVSVEHDNFIRRYGYIKNFHVIWLPDNVGHGNARRIGLEHCSNNLVALMDADDISAFDRFEKQFKCFQEDRTLSVVGGYINEFMNSVNNVVGTRSVPQDDLAIKDYLKKRCPFNQMTVMLKRDDVQAAGGYLDWYCDEDYYLWVRMYLQGMKFKNVADILVYARVGSETYHRRGGWKYFNSEAKLQVFMLREKVIGLFEFIFNIAIRFLIQILIPSAVRGIVFRNLLRRSVKCGKAVQSCES